ncbi:multicomponent Na+:H+ antiporter subunit C [Raineyella antarctica]|uniref:Multicomponent Na+:H+ antiporter subunit C n=1 Tax=Raineyella antarctica TaxID=1577474 RepID=A0A1G6H1V8_9ACTN|nr:Na(+)/H(+) antiporter subunit C [Raineyella antarctica]SDB88133.1 multicomponent Na+:H+ antiporter subunit C [Raineyella antarctica]
MEPNLTLLLVSGFLIACGVYLLLERSLTRILIGILLTSNGVNLLYPLIAGPARRPAFVNLVPADEVTDPLPQAMVLTAIVITLATTAFLLAMAYRAVQVNGDDGVQDDVEDAVIRRLAALDEASQSFDSGVGSGEPGEEEGGDFFDVEPGPLDEAPDDVLDDDEDDDADDGEPIGSEKAVRVSSDGRERAADVTTDIKEAQR